MRKLFLILTLVLFSCSEDETTQTTGTNSIDVYTAGVVNDNAAYWKNGTNFLLNNGGFAKTHASKILVSNGNTYILGGATPVDPDANPPQDSAFLFWENGVVENLGTFFSEPNFEVYSIYDFHVDNNDVYILGLMRSTVNNSEFELVYWMNGRKTVFRNNARFAGGGSIRILNNDLYVHYTDNLMDGVSGVFKNGIFTAFTVNLGAQKVQTTDSELFVYGVLPNSTNGYYYNTNTGVQTNTPFFVSRLDFDQNDLYTLALGNGANFLQDIFKNGVPYYSAPSGSVINEFDIYNNESFMVIYEDSISEQTVYHNNTVIFSLTNISPDNYITDLFVYDN